MDRPPVNDVCSICHHNFHIPCEANCSHWFCGMFYLRDCEMILWNPFSGVEIKVLWRIRILLIVVLTVRLNLRSFELLLFGLIACFSVFVVGLTGFLRLLEMWNELVKFVSIFHFSVKTKVLCRIRISVIIVFAVRLGLFDPLLFGLFACLMCLLLDWPVGSVEWFSEIRFNFLGEDLSIMLD